MTKKDPTPIDGLCEDDVVDLGPIPEHASAMWPDLDLSTYGPQEAPWRKKRRSMVDSVVEGLASFTEMFKAKSAADNKDKGAGEQGERAGDQQLRSPAEEDRRPVDHTDRGRDGGSSSPKAPYLSSPKRLLPARMDDAKQQGSDTRSDAEYRVRVETVMKKLGVGQEEAVRVLASIESGQLEGALS
eukprot:3883611-Rhodomonas_salina.1